MATSIPLDAWRKAGFVARDTARRFSDFRCLGVVVCLQAQPEPRRGAQGARQTNGGVGADGAAPGADFADAGRLHADSFRQTVRANTQRVEKLFLEHFAGVDVGQSVHVGFQSVVIANIHARGVPFVPNKTYPPLVVDADAVLTGTIAGQRLQPVVGRNAQIGELSGVVQHPQFAARNGLDLIGQLAGKAAAPNGFGRRVVKRNDHVS